MCKEFFELKHINEDQKRMNIISFDYLNIFIRYIKYVKIQH
jgi:hypothetical protein